MMDHIVYQLDKVLFSPDLFEKQFVCNLNACKGACCVEGDGGAPLSEEEAQILEQILPIIKPSLSLEGQEVLEAFGPWVEEDGDLATPLIGDKGACAYTLFDEQGIAVCGIEKQWEAGNIKFRKPLSCHLYPLRVAKLASGLESLNYHNWNICSPACANGVELGVPVYVFLKEALIRAYGEVWYDALCQVVTEESGRSTTD